MNGKTVYASNLEKKLIDEFKERFREKLGYQPVVLTRVVVDNEYHIPIMDLGQLSAFFEPFLARHNNRKIHLFAKNRKREVVELRMMFCYIARQMMYTYASIGEYMRNRDHTTVLHNVATFKNLMETNEDFKERYTRIITHIKQQYESPTLDQPDQA